MEDVMAQPRLLQVFLGMNGAYEVSVTPIDHSLVCNCPGYRMRRQCKHVTYVKDRITDDGGYVVDLPDNTRCPTPEDARDPETWRKFVLHNAPVVVL